MFDATPTPFMDAMKKAKNGVDLFQKLLHQRHEP